MKPRRCSYYHLAAAADEQAIKTLQQRDFFKHYNGKRPGRSPAATSGDAD